jgi:hypothetical protein
MLEAYGKVAMEAQVYMWHKHDGIVNDDPRCRKCSRSWPLFIPEGHTENKEMYIKILRCLRAAVRMKCPEKWA